MPSLNLDTVLISKLNEYLASRKCWPMAATVVENRKLLDGIQPYCNVFHQQAAGARQARI